MNFLCPYCKLSVDTDNLFFAHIKLKHRFNLYEKVICAQPACFRSFGDFYTYKKHVISKHSISSRNIKTVQVRDAPVKDQNQHGCFETNYNVELNSSEANEEYVPNKEEDCTIDIDDIRTSIEDGVLHFLGQLYSNSKISRALIQEIVDTSSELFDTCVYHVQQVMKKKKIEDSEIHEVLDVVKTPFQNLNTHHLRQKYFEKAQYLINPVSYSIAPTTVRTTHQNTEILDLKTSSGQFVPMREVLKSFLELPNVFSSLMTYMDKIQNSSPDVIDSILKGSIWKEIQSSSKGKLFLPLSIYFDDLEINNPLGSHSKVNKIGAVYYKISCLPPQHISKLENIFLAMLHKTVDRKLDYESILDIIFKPLIDELTILQNDGICVNIGKTKKQVYFAPVVFAGDNLGIHLLYGLNESFNSCYYCRFCREDKTVMSTQSRENVESLRTIDNYKSDLSDKKFGIKQPSVFRYLPNFHITKYLYVDVMHDLFEGICRYELPLIFNELINTDNLITLCRLNNRIKFFSYGNVVTNKGIPPLTEIHLHNQYYQCTASEMKCLLEYLGLMIGDLIPRNNKTWKLYILLREIECMIMQDIFEEETLVKLEKVIRQHHKLYLKLSADEEHLKPKFHFLLHYVRVIKTIGPLWSESCIRFEARHKKLKEYAQTMRCRKNICYSLAFKNQLEFCDRMIKNHGVDSTISIGPTKIVMLQTYKEFEKFKMYVPEILCISPITTSEWIQANSIKYTKEMMIVIEQEKNLLQFGEIMEIFIDSSSKKATFLIKKYKTIGFEEHYHSFAIDPSDEWMIFYQEDLMKYKPKVKHYIGSKCYVIC